MNDMVATLLENVERAGLKGEVGLLRGPLRGLLAVEESLRYWSKWLFRGLGYSGFLFHDEGVDERFLGASSKER